jgi:glycosyltransferase involved in cell wall biosynthesis
MIREKIVFIPNWATVTPGVRPADAGNPFRPAGKPRFIAGLSGNLGFTHDPIVVFEAAKLLREDTTIHFLLSGWGIGFEKLKALQGEANLPNVTFVERVAEQDLERLLSAADVWIIPYRKNVSGVSIPSRFYNLLAVGRPVILGWVVLPGMPAELAQALRVASLSNDPSMAERAVAVAENFSLGRAMTSYARLIHALLPDPKQPGRLS